MSLSLEDVQKIADLARLELSPEEAQKFAHGLSNILKMVDELSAADTSHVSPLEHPQELTQWLRPDLITETNEREALLKNAPAQEAGLFLVPQVVE